MQRSGECFLGFLLCAALGAAVYLNTLHAPFVYDDIYYVQKNPLVRNVGGVLRAFVTPFSPSAPGLYRPVTVMSYAATYAIFGLDPKGFHFGNILLHALTAGLLFVVALQLIGAFVPALVAGFLFAVHPVHTEAVAWVSGQSEILAGVFVLLSVLFFLRSRYIISAIAFLLALLSKEIAAPLPVVLLLINHQTLKPSNSQNLFSPRRGFQKAAVPFAIALFLYLPFRFIALGGLTVPTELSRTGSLSFFERLWLLPPVLARYLRTAIWPTGLRVEYDWATFSGLTVALSLVAVLATIALGVLLWKRRMSAAALGIAWFFLFLTPVMNIVPIGEFIAERFLYTASMGICLLVGSLIARQYRRTFIPVVALLLIFSFLTVDRNRDWRDPEMLWRETLRLSPNAPHALQNLTALLLAKGEYEGALELNKRTVALWPEKPMVHVLSGKIYGALSRPDLQRAAYEHALSLASLDDIEFTDFQRGTVLVELGRFGDALPYLQSALQGDPYDGSALNNFGIAQAQTGNIGGAQRSFERAIELLEGVSGRSAEEEENYRGAVENFRMLGR